MALSQVSAGGIIVRKREGETQVCLILDDYGHWTFPKGKLEPGETNEQAALREVCEEVGIAKVVSVQAAGVSQHRFLIGSEACKKTVHWFLMEVAPDVECTPMPAERVHDAGWFTPQQALSTIGYRNMRSLLRRALKALGERT
ncbi:MAG: NUDIX hydrolase [Armatimonadota bacterium]|nr:MAG: NUDIX hydrolase [Armatimonadota bacterium]